MKRIFTLIVILACYFFTQSFITVNASTITFEDIYDQKLDVSSIESNYFDISAFLASYSDVSITGGNFIFSFVDDIDPLSSWTRIDDYQLKKIETYNRSSNWQLYYERDVSYYFSDDEYEYYYAGILGDNTYGGNIQRNNFSMFTSYDYSVYNYNAWLDDKHYYTNTYQYNLGSYGDYSLSKDLTQTNLSSIDDSGIINYEVGVYGSDAIFKSAMLTLEFTGKLITVDEPASLSLFIIMVVALFFWYRRTKFINKE